MLSTISNTFQPSRFQGAGRHRSYFEGYYIKVVDPVQQVALAFIPGISYDAEGKGEAFVQLIDGVDRFHAHYSFAPEQFLTPAPAAGESFVLQIAGQSFSDRACEWESDYLRASLGFRQNQPWPWHPWSPGAMGPFSFVPAMQCKHGVVSLWHRVEGQIYFKQRQQAVQLSDQAYGYIEKDWGSGFPKRWIWLQSNHFLPAVQPACVMVSAGHVPWIVGSFEGHIAALLIDKQQWTFSTYNGSQMRYDIQPQSLSLLFEKRKLQLSIHANRPAIGIEVNRPESQGALSGKVNETLQATASVELKSAGVRLFECQIEWTGLEIGGSWPNS